MFCRDHFLKKIKLARNCKYVNENYKLKHKYMHICSTVLFHVTL